MDKLALLTGELPSGVTVGGTFYRAETDFRCGLLISALLDEPVSPWMKADLALKLFSPALRSAVRQGQVPAGDALRGMLRFYDCGEEKSGRGGERVLDFSVDAGRIYAGFRAAYGIDLSHARLHWRQFYALLCHLPEDTALMRVVRLRMTDTAAIRDDEARRRVRQAKARVRLPIHREEVFR